MCQKIGTQRQQAAELRPRTVEEGSLAVLGRCAMNATPGARKEESSTAVEWKIGEEEYRRVRRRNQELRLSSTIERQGERYQTTQRWTA